MCTHAEYAITGWWTCNIRHIHWYYYMRKWVLLYSKAGNLTLLICISLYQIIKLRAQVEECVKQAWVAASIGRGMAECSINLIKTYIS